MIPAWLLSLLFIVSIIQVPAERLEWRSQLKTSYCGVQSSDQCLLMFNYPAREPPVKLASCCCLRPFEFIEEKPTVFFFFFFYFVKKSEIYLTVTNSAVILSFIFSATHEGFQLFFFFFVCLHTKMTSNRIRRVWRQWLVNRTPGVCRTWNGKGKLFSAS